MERLLAADNSMKVLEINDLCEIEDIYFLWDSFFIKSIALFINEYHTMGSNTFISC